MSELKNNEDDLYRFEFGSVDVNDVEDVTDVTDVTASVLTSVDVNEDSELKEQTEDQKSSMTTTKTTTISPIQSFLRKLYYCPYGFDVPGLHLANRKMVVYSGSEQTGKTSLATTQMFVELFANRRNKNVDDHKEEEEDRKNNKEDDSDENKITPMDLFSDNFKSLLNSLLNITKYLPSLRHTVVYHLVRDSTCDDVVELAFGSTALSEKINTVEELFQSQFMKTIFQCEKDDWYLKPNDIHEVPSNIEAAPEAVPFVIVIRGRNVSSNVSIIDMIPMTIQTKKTWIRFRRNDHFAGQGKKELLSMIPEQVFRERTESYQYMCVKTGCTFSSPMDIWFAGLWERRKEVASLTFVVTIPLPTLVSRKLGSGFPSLMYYRILEATGTTPGIMNSLYIAVTKIDKVQMHSVPVLKWQSILCSNATFFQFGQNDKFPSKFNYGNSYNNNKKKNNSNDDERTYCLGKYKSAGLFFATAVSEDTKNTELDVYFSKLRYRGLPSMKYLGDYMELSKQMELVNNFIKFEYKFIMTLRQKMDQHKLDVVYFREVPVKADMNGSGNSLDGSGHSSNNSGHSPDGSGHSSNNSGHSPDGSGHPKSLGTLDRNLFMKFVEVPETSVVLKCYGFIRHFVTQRMCSLQKDDAAFERNERNEQNTLERNTLETSALWYERLSKEYRENCFTMCHENQRERKRLLDKFVSERERKIQHQERSPKTSENKTTATDSRKRARDFSFMSNVFGNKNKKTFVSNDTSDDTNDDTNDKFSQTLSEEFKLELRSMISDEISKTISKTVSKTVSELLSDIHEKTLTDIKSVVDDAMVSVQNTIEMTMSKKLAELSKYSELSK